MRRTDGQILPGLMMLLLAIIALGVLVFGIGRSALLRSDAQTAADAAALAGARNVRDQLEAQMATRGYTSLGDVDAGQVQADAEDYARRNDAVLTRAIALDNSDVKVWVATREDVGSQLGRGSGSADTQGRAQARGRLEAGAAAAGGAAGLPVSDSSEGPPPECTGDRAKVSADGGAKGIVESAVGVARCAGGDGVYVGSSLRPGSITSGGSVSDHSRNDATQAARDIGARGLDLIVGPPSPKLDRGAMAIGRAFGREYGAGAQRIVDTFAWKGYRVQIIWRTPQYGGHMGHIHIGVRRGGAPAGAPPSLGGEPSVLASELTIKLVDFDAPSGPDFTLGESESESGSGGGPQASGGNPFGPPDPAVGAKLCKVLADLDAPPKARLALWEAAIVESGVHDLSDGHATSVGVLQLLDIHFGGSVSLRRDVELVARHFLLYSFTRPGRGNGAIGVARRSPGMTAGMVAQTVQGSAYPDRYDERRDQAVAMDARFCGGKGR